MRCASVTILALGLALPLSALESAGLSGTLWQCTRANDQARFVMTFYPDGGVGGGEIQNGAVIPYLFDTSRTPAGRWPGSWYEREDRFRWMFPDQHLVITGHIRHAEGKAATLVGSEQGADATTAIACRRLRPLPSSGSGFVIAADGHFMGAESGEGVLKVPARSSLP